LIIVSSIAFAMCMTIDLSKFAIVGKIALFCLIYISIVLFFQLFQMFDIKNADQINLFGDFDVIQICTCFTSVLFAFNSVINIFSSILPLKNPSESRITIIVSISSLSV